MSIKEIAKIANVSPATVSRVLNNPDYRCASPETREKIRKAAIKLNYVPNEAARKLKTGKYSAEKAYYISILITRTDSAHIDPFFDELLRVIETEMHKNNCILSKVYYRSLFSSEKRCQREALNHMIESMHDELNGHSDGLIIIGKCAKSALALFQKVYGNVVCVSRNSSNGQAEEVICDGKQIASIAVEHLIELGHTSIGYIGQCRDEARYKGFQETMQKHNLQLLPEFIVETDQTEAGGYEAVEEFLKLEDYPTAIYCCNDITAVGVLKNLAKRKNVYKPSVISSDDIDEAQFTTPMLTTVHLPKEDMGRIAIKLLLDRIRKGHKAIVKVELQCRLVVRESCSYVQESGWNDYCI